MSVLENIFPGDDNIFIKTFFSDELIFLSLSFILIVILFKFNSASPILLDNNLFGSIFILITFFTLNNSSLGSKGLPI